MNTEKKRAILFVGIVYTLTFLCSFPLFFIKDIVSPQTMGFIIMIVGMVFMWFPTVSALITRKVTGDSFKIKVKPHLKRDWKLYASACFLPGILTCVGAVAFFLIFPDKLDFSWSYVQTMLGVTPPFALEISTLILIGFVVILAAPLVVVNHLLAFGEEYGWRGYLLRKLGVCMSERKAVIVSGALWGLGHAPLVCFGLNYNTGYPGFPFTGILMMIVFAVVIGVWFSDLTVRTESVLAASIAHGALNAVREIPLFISVLGVNTLLGPKPSGLIGMIGLMILAAACLKRWKVTLCQD